MALSLRAAYTGTVDSTTRTGVSVVVGDLIIALISYGENSGVDPHPTVSDNAAGGTNSYNEVGSGGYAQFTGAVHVYYAIAKATETLTLTISSAPSFCRVNVHVVSGNNQTLASVLDVYNTVPSSFDTAQTTNNITTTNANDYIVVGWRGVYTTATENGTGFTERCAERTFDKIVSATGTYNEAITLDAASYCVGIIASFKAASTTTKYPTPVFYPT